MHRSFILNLYIVYELNIWQGNLTNNFTKKIVLFSTVKLARTEDKSEFT